MKALLAAAIVVAASAAGLSPASAKDGPPPGALRVIQSNIASGAECPLTNDCLGTLEEQIKSFDPDVVSGQEFCEVTADEFRADYPTWEVYYVPLVSTPMAGCGGTSKGQIIAGPDLHDVEIYDLPGDQQTNYFRDFKMVCARTPDNRRNCAVHLRAGGDPDDVEARSDQVNAILDITDGWARHTISGDFNLRSDNSIFKRLANNGYLDTEPGHVIHILTHGQEKDYSGGTAPQPTSDHPLIRAWVDWVN